MTIENIHAEGTVVTLTDDNGKVTNTFQTLDTFTLEISGSKSKFTKELHTYTGHDGSTRSEMHLIGGRGARYVLHPYNSAHPKDKGMEGALYYAGSYTGGILKKHGNTVIFFMIGGEFSYHRSA